VDADLPVGVGARSAAVGRLADSDGSVWPLPPGGGSRTRRRRPAQGE